MNTSNPHSLQTGVQSNEKKSQVICDSDGAEKTKLFQKQAKIKNNIIIEEAPPQVQHVNNFSTTGRDKYRKDKSKKISDRGNKRMELALKCADREAKREEEKNKAVNTNKRPILTKFK